jgi:hypothetical protein
MLFAKRRVYESLRRDHIDDMSWLEAVRADWNLAVTYKLCGRYLKHWWKPSADDLFGNSRQCRVCKITEMLPDA